MRLRQVIRPIGPSIAYIELTKGLYSLVDSKDADELGKYNWYATRNSRNHRGFYAMRTINLNHSRALHVQMHRDLLHVQDELIVDHINGRTLDNRRVNLRIMTIDEHKKHHNNTQARDKGRYL
jgi:hypothetical protein